MNFKQVETFRAVMLSGSMTAAADALHTSQPNISRLIMQLEDSTGLRLFERINGRLHPTEEGIALFQEVERAFVGLRTVEDSARQIRQFGSGRLRIAAPSSMSLSFLPRVIQQFRLAHPKVAISLQTTDSSKTAQSVASRQCDLGLVSYISGDIPGAIAELVCDVPGVCVLPPAHHLTALDTVSPEDLEGEDFISMMHDDGARARIDRYFDQHEIRRAMNIETPFAATICSMVGLGLGVSIVHPLVAADFLHTGIQVRPFRPALNFSSHLMRSAHAPFSVLAQRFIDLLSVTLKQSVKDWQ